MTDPNNEPITVEVIRDGRSIMLEAQIEADEDHDDGDHLQRMRDLGRRDRDGQRA